MKHEKYSQNIFVYQLKYLNESNSNIENFQALKSNLPIYKFLKFVRLTNFPKVIGESHKLCKVVHSFYEVHSSYLRVPQTL